MQGLLPSKISTPSKKIAESEMFRVFDYDIEVKGKARISSQIEGVGILHGRDKHEIFEYINANSGIENGAGGSAGTGSEGNASSTPSSGGSNEGADSGSGSTGSGENSALQNPSES